MNKENTQKELLAQMTATIFWVTPILILVMLIVIYAVYMFMNDTGLTTVGKILSAVVFLILAFLIEGFFILGAGKVKISEATGIFFFCAVLFSRFFFVFSLLAGERSISGFFYWGIISQMACGCYFLADEATGKTFQRMLVKEQEEAKKYPSVHNEPFFVFELDIESLRYCLKTVY